MTKEKKQIKSLMRKVRGLDFGAIKRVWALKALSVFFILGIVTLSFLNPEKADTKGVAKASIGIAGAAALSLLPWMKRKEGADRLFNGGGGGAPELSEKEKAVLDHFKKEVNTQVDAKLKDFKPEEKNLEEIQSFKDLKKMAEEATTKKDFDILKDLVNEFGLKIAKYEEGGRPGSLTAHKSFAAAFEEAYNEKKEEIDRIVKNNGKMDGPLRFEVKAAVVMQVDNTIEAGATHNLITSFTGIISTIRKRMLTYLSSVALGTPLPVDKPYAMWVEEYDEQGSPIFIGEGDAKTQLSVKYKELEKRAKKIAVYGKVSTEMMRYLPQLINYIQNNLIRRMDIKTEDQLFNGDDAGDNLKGLIPYAVDFDGGIGTAGGAGLVDKVKFPCNADVLRAVALQVFNSYGMAGKIFITPDAEAEMDVEKTEEGIYLLPPFKSVDGKTIAGMQIVPSNALQGTGYDFVGGDLSVVNVQFLNQTGVQIGLDGNDFTQNKKTMLVEQELVQFVSANDLPVIVKGDFETAKGIIDYVAPNP